MFHFVVAGTLFDGSNYAGYVGEQDLNTVRSASFKYPGASNTYPYGINASGVVVGGYADSNFNWHAFLRQPVGRIWQDGVLVNVDPPGANGNAWANAINDSGTFAGPVGSLGFITFP